MNHQRQSESHDNPGERRDVHVVHPSSEVLEFAGCHGKEGELATSELEASARSLAMCRRDLRR